MSNAIVIAAVLVVAVVLLLGLINMMRGGSPQRSQQLMRMRVALQFVAIVIIMIALCGFAVASQYANMVLGIAFMVFFASLAADNYSWLRNVKITVALIAVAYAFEYLLGLNLPLPGPH